MQCPCCGSEELVWDYRSGFVVCPYCGCVADSIAVHQPLASSDESGHSRKSVERLYRLERGLRRRLAREAAKRFELEKKSFVFIDNRPVHLRSLAALRTLESNAGVKELVEEGLAIVEAVSPTALCKSLRGRYALAYAVAKLLRGEELNLRELEKLFSVSRATAFRLFKEAEEIVKTAESIGI
jgi:transcription initiation factor TFIIIB Brf1 subunit/transcription initiation factor TFIIB